MDEIIYSKIQAKDCGTLSNCEEACLCSGYVEGHEIDTPPYGNCIGMVHATKITYDSGKVCCCIDY